MHSNSLSLWQMVCTTFRKYPTKGTSKEQVSKLVRSLKMRLINITCPYHIILVQIKNQERFSISRYTSSYVLHMVLYTHCLRVVRS